MTLIRLETVPKQVAPQTTRRKVTSRTGKAMTLLAHALEYLSDEYVSSHGSELSLRPQMEAITLLMALNRGIYLECPETPTAAARCRAIFRRCFHLLPVKMGAARQSL